MKRWKMSGSIRYWFPVLLLGFLVGCFFVTPGWAADKPIHWKFQTLVTGERLPPFKDFADKIRVATGGRITMEVFPSGAIVPTKEMASAVGAGTLDCAFTYGGYHSGFVDIANIESGLPMGWANAAEAMMFHFVTGFRELARQAYDERGVYWVTPAMETPFYLLTKKPVSSLNDLKKYKIRATAPVGAVLKEFGISTVYLPSEEFYTALSTGVVDGVIFGSEYAYASLKLQEQASYIADMKILNPMTSAFIINKKAWNSLSPDLQMIVEQTATAFFPVTIYSQYAIRDREVRMKGTFKYQLFSHDDVAKLTKAAQNVWDKEATKSPRAAKAVEMLRQVAKETGRL
jgi:TRAP-type C4-dicarboxylate transport system substrate-binding protein